MVRLTEGDLCRTKREEEQEGGREGLDVNSDDLENSQPRARYQSRLTPLRTRYSARSVASMSGVKLAFILSGNT